VTSKDLVREVYGFTSAVQTRKDFAFCDQIRKAATSVMSNIAEGFGRHSDRDFARFLDIARGSAAETRSLLHVARDVGYLDREGFDRLERIASQVTAQITVLSQYLRGTLRS
jgi:four helix bundle protein